jgi:transcriptional regulator with XRE-family HTH domain
MMQDNNVQQANFSVRLEERMSKLRLSQHSLAAKLSTTQSTVRGWLNGALPRERILNELAEALSVNTHWLRTGEGESDAITGTVREEATPYKYTQRTPTPRLAQSSTHLSGCLAMLEAMTDVTTPQAFDYASMSFEKTWEKFKAAKQTELNQLPP